MRPSQLLAAVLAVSSVSAAWPDVLDNVNGLADHVLFARQDDNSESAQPTKTDAPKSSASGDKPQSTGDSDKSSSAKESDKPSSTQKESGKSTSSGKASSTGTKTSGKPKTTEFDPRLPAGGISMITPAPIAGAQFYKIGEWVTFAWNYTSLSVTPSAIDILATCTANQATYTLAVNQTVDKTGMILWDTNKTQETGSVPLLTEQYTLMIYDSDQSVSATPQAGYLGVYSQFTFGMYTPQPYVNWSMFHCANCNPSSALSNYERMTLKVMLFTTGTTIASLVYFAFSFGVL